MLAVTAAVLCAAAGAPSVSSQQDRSARVAPPPSSHWGVGTSAQSAGNFAVWMPKMAAAGVRWVRDFPGWNTLEPTRGQFNFTPADELIAAASANGLTLTGMLAYNAAWNGDSHGMPNTTAQLQAWSNYVGKTVTHAADRVKFWEVWNEPQNFKSGDQNASDYAAVVVAAYNAAKAADPGAAVGLTVASVDVLYLEQALAAGAAGHYDYVCVHPYETLGTVDEGQEALFMSIVPTVRKMLAARDPPNANAEVQFTELGEALGPAVTNTSQAVSLLKAYTLGIAQGASKVDWFEASGDAFRMGLVDSKGNPRPAYNALSILAKSLGVTPAYAGWLRWHAPRNDYGFVFTGTPSGAVLVAWGPPGGNATAGPPVPLGATVQVVDFLTGASAPSSSVTLLSTPVIALGVPGALVQAAAANKGKPLPWGEYEPGASRNVSTTAGAPNSGNGLHMLNQDEYTLTPIGGTWGRSPDGGWTWAGADVGRDAGAAAAVSFAVDPSFLDYATAAINITATVRRHASNANAGFNLKYESRSGRGSVGWNTVPEDPSVWHDITITVRDDEFVGKWGYEFAFDSDVASQAQYYIKQVTVTLLQ